ncbi:hypothetical protein ACFL09_00460 [Planctomycetota bacterium]
MGMLRTQVVCLAIALAQVGASAGELVISAADFPLEVGRRATYQIVTGGEPRAELRAALVGARRVGKVLLVRESVLLGTMQVPGSWIEKGEGHVAFYPSFGAELPSWRYPMPLKKGLEYEYEAVTGQVKGRVEGPDTVGVPAGKHTCLVVVEERAEGTRKFWIAPGVGIVRVQVGAAEGAIVSLTKFEEPYTAKPAPKTVAMSTFDRGSLLGSAAFPLGRWGGVAGRPRPRVVAIDPWTGAAGTPFSLKWAYHAKGTWVAASFNPSGDAEKPADLSKYKFTTFWIKAAHAGHCAVSIRAKHTVEDRRITVNIPIRVTTQWRKVTLSDRIQEQLNTIDPKEVYSVGLGAYSQQKDANIIWLDEVIFHLGELPAEL